MRICRLIGQECLKQTCDQYNPVTGVCKFSKRIGNIMYRPLDLNGLMSFLKYLEEVRPVEREEKL